MNWTQDQVGSTLGFVWTRIRELVSGVLLPSAPFQKRFSYCSLSSSSLSSISYLVCPPLPCLLSCFQLFSPFSLFTVVDRYRLIDRLTWRKVALLFVLSPEQTTLSSLTYTLFFWAFLSSFLAPQIRLH